MVQITAVPVEGTTNLIRLETLCRDPFGGGCGKEFSTTVSRAELDLYNSGEFVQRAFPLLSADERELFFISGLCGECYDELMGGM